MYGSSSTEKYSYCTLTSYSKRLVRRKLKTPSSDSPGHSPKRRAMTSNTLFHGVWPAACSCRLAPVGCVKLGRS